MIRTDNGRLGLLQPGPVAAGGLYVNEFGTTSQGNAGAGRCAWETEASVALHNPASITRFDDHAFSTGLDVAYGNVHFDADATSPSGGSGRSRSREIPPGPLRTSPAPPWLNLSA